MKSVWYFSHFCSEDMLHYFPDIFRVFWYKLLKYVLQRSASVCLVYSIFSHFIFYWHTMLVFRWSGQVCVCVVSQSFYLISDKTYAFSTWIIFSVAIFKMDFKLWQLVSLYMCAYLYLFTRKAKKNNIHTFIFKYGLNVSWHTKR